MGFLQPIIGLSVSMQYPHLPSDETFTPIRPGFTLVLPFALHGIHGQEIRIGFHQIAHLIISEIQSCFTSGLER